jgi:hypothetical protein
VIARQAHLKATTGTGADLPDQDALAEPSTCLDEDRVPRVEYFCYKPLTRDEN